MRQEGYQTKIRKGKKDYLLIAKLKGDLTPWAKIPPMIEPPNIRLFEVGNISNELEEKIKNDSRIRHENKIKMIKDNEDKANEEIEEQNLKDIQQMRLEYEDINQTQDRISDTEL